MYKDGVVTFANWNKGQVKHPIYGFGLLKNVEVFENKGIAKLKNRAVLRSSITPTQLPIAEVYDIYGNTYTLDGGAVSGTCYKNGTSIQGSLGLTWDLAIYKDYLWIRHSTVLSAYGPLSSGGAQWFGNVETGFASGYSGKIIIGQDDYLYIANGNYVAKISVTASGTVGVAPTLSSNLTALDLPDGQYVSDLEEYGTKIVIGTHGGSSYFDRGNSTIARLYAWNRQLGTLGNPGLADLPIIFNENGVNSIKQHANKLYVSAGTQGNIYVTDSTNYQKIALIPYTQSGVNYGSTVYANAIDISAQGTLLVGISGSYSDETRAGIYEIDISDPSYPISYRTPTSTNETTLNIGFINSVSYQTINVGWSNGSSYGVDTTDFRMYASYGGVIETSLVQVGRYNAKKTFEHIEWDLAEPLVSGQNIRISYRKNSREDYTEIGTWGFSTTGAVMSFEDVAAIADCEYIQLKIELDQSTSTLYGYNVNLIQISLW